MSEKSRILIVDDESFNLNVLVDLLKDDYKTLIAKNGEQALKRATAQPAPDLILLDIMMPGMDGYEVCKQLKADPQTASIPVIFISAMSEENDETRGLELGAVDYLTKPISPAIVRARVRNHLALKQAREQLANQNRELEQRVVERTRELAITQDVTILSMASLAETRDNETGNHIRRTQHYVKLLAEHLRHHPRFAEVLDDDRTIELLYKSAPLHDIGKVGVPDAILLKPGKLTEDEFAEMMKHPAYGRDAIKEAEKALFTDDPNGAESSFLRYAREIAYGHHEKWDGSGYPQGLSGDEIPISARLMAVADVYDALICRRVYKPPFSYEQAQQIIIEGRGQHFDPDVVDAFAELREQFTSIAEQFADRDP